MIDGWAKAWPTETPDDTSDVGLLGSSHFTVAELTNALRMSHGSVT
ncbi:hypothetical protein [Streptomyces achromogenes]